MNTTNRYRGRILSIATLLLVTLVAGCSNSSNDNGNGGTEPAVSETSPADSANAVALNSKVTATFSVAMDDSTIDTLSFTVVGAGEPALTGAVSLDASSNTASFTPGSNFTASTVYTATLTDDVMSMAGSALAADYAWSFTSGTAADNTAPTVISTNPTDAATGIALNQNLSANFNEAVDPATVNAASFTLRDSGTPVAGVVSYSNKVATFNPDSNLAASTTYDATLTTAVTDLAGPANALAADVTWSFTTGTAVASGPTAINLRTAANFAILSKTGITSEDGSATITGNIGSSPVSGADNTVICAEFAGYSIFTDDAAFADATCVDSDKSAASLAIADVLTAYTNASAPATPAGVGPFLELGAGTVTAQSLVPGVYTWAGNVSITGEITLDGSATDVWIFQIDGTLDTDQTITLAGGALAKNVFWRVADVVTLGTGAQFKGVVLAQTNIVMITGTTTVGRLLAQTAVVLGTNAVVTQPAP